MNTLKYKGYIGSVAYSEPDKVFYGKIEGIDGLINYEGESVKDLTAAFREAVDDYLIFCEEHNCKPQKSYTGTFNVRITPETHRGIAILAAEAGISINAFVKKALSEAVSNSFATTSSLVEGYGVKPPKMAAALREPEYNPSYGTRETHSISIPQKDITLAKDLFTRLGWQLK